MFLSINISNSDNINKFWVGIFSRQGHINEVYLRGVSELVSEKGSQRSDSGPIKIKYEQSGQMGEGKGAKRENNMLNNGVTYRYM